MCIMDRRDMQLLVKHIYFILYNPNKGRVTMNNYVRSLWSIATGNDVYETFKWFSFMIIFLSLFLIRYDIWSQLVFANCKTTQDAINRASLFLYSYPHKLDHVLALAKM